MLLVSALVSSWEQLMTTTTSTTILAGTILITIMSIPRVVVTLAGEVTVVLEDSSRGGMKESVINELSNYKIDRLLDMLSCQHT